MEFILGVVGLFAGLFIVFVLIIMALVLLSMLPLIGGIASAILGILTKRR